ncbi:MAG: hypothetical protein ACRCXD_19445 [Luteolibacter sp.]
MKKLRLPSLPSVRQHEETAAQQIERDGFVDDEAVLALLNGPTYLRSSSYPEDLVLAADDLDFAGWQVASAPVTRPAEVPPQVIDAIVRRAAPPLSTEPGIGSPHLGSHRWWLAGLAGAFSTLLFALLLVFLSSREQPTPEADTSVAAPSREPVMILEVAPKAEVPLDLTDAFSHQP